MLLVVNDFVFKDKFIYQELLWPSSFICFFLFSIYLNYSILSLLLSCLMSFSRMMIVIYPFDSKFRNKTFVLKYCILMCGFTAILVMGFTVIILYFYGSLPFRLCSPFIDPTHSNMILRIATCFVVCLQFTIYILNVLFKSKTILELKDFREKAQISLSQKDYITSSLVQFSVLTMSNTLCCIPSGIIFLICMFIDEFSIHMVTWVVITVSSVNSITNPTVFIITTVRKWNQSGRLRE